MKEKTGKYFAVDIETSGLDPKKCAILEVAWIILDASLKELQRESHVVHASEYVLSQMNDHVRNMHEKNGLLEEVECGTRIELVVKRAKARVDQFFAEGKKPVLMGSSVHFDRSFLELHAPGMLNGFSHRHVDTNTPMELKLMNRGSRAASNHRAMDDIEESVRRLRSFRNSVLRSKQR